VRYLAAAPIGVAANVEHAISTIRIKVDRVFLSVIAIPPYGVRY
jgi:hypothetical protein